MLTKFVALVPAPYAALADTPTPLTAPTVSLMAGDALAYIVVIDIGILAAAILPRRGGAYGVYRPEGIAELR